MTRPTRSAGRTRPLRIARRPLVVPLPPRVAEPLLPGSRQRAAPVLLAIGTTAVLGGLAVIWAARLTVPYPVYVSELGALGAPTAAPFAVALLSIAAGGFAIALASAHIRSAAPVLRRWAPALSLGFAGLCFVIASQITCTAYCPVPLVDPHSTVRDLVHTSTAVLGFAAACYAMLQVAFAAALPRIARFSLLCCVAVAVITIVGGLLAIVHVATDLGSWLELTGTTVAIAWLAIYGMSLARIPAREATAPQ